MSSLHLKQLKKSSILAGRGLKEREIVVAVGIKYGSVVSILNDHLYMTMLPVKCVIHLLIIDNKRNRVTTSKDCLALFNRNVDKSLLRFKTVDKRRGFTTTHQEPRNNESEAKNAKVNLSSKKIIVPVFWDALTSSTFKWTGQSIVDILLSC